jgi:hypothetical protein
MRTLSLLLLSLFVAPCSSTLGTTTTTTQKDTLITVPATVSHDTLYLPPVYHGGTNAGCDTAAILASASFNITQTDTTGRVSVYDYNALLGKFEALNSRPPKKIIVPIETKNSTLIEKSMSFGDYIKIGSVAIVLFIGLLVIGYAVAKGGIKFPIGL